MKNFLDWLFNAEHTFTFVTVILSGIISWIISAIYYRKTNRNALRQNVIYPIKRKIKERRSLDNYRELEALSKVFETRYFSKQERQKLNNLLEEYHKICEYDRSYVYAESLFSYFCKILEENGVDINVIPEYCEGELMGYSTPSELYYLVDDIKRIIDDLLPEYDFDNEIEPIEDKIKRIFKAYCKLLFEDKEIDYFKNTTVHEIYKYSSDKAEWDKKLSNYNLIEKEFLETKICK